MDAGARGCLVIISGKITGARHRVEKFQKGHIKFCGETALDFMDTGFSVCVKKLGTIGCTVRIMRKGIQLPHEINIHERHEVGLDPIEEVSMIEAPKEDSNETEAEVVVDSVLQKMADLETSETKEEE
jgi:small subunit ribosomal protein S3